MSETRTGGLPRIQRWYHISDIVVHSCAISIQARLGQHEKRSWTSSLRASESHGMGRYRLPHLYENTSSRSALRRLINIVSCHLISTWDTRGRRYTPQKASQRARASRADTGGRQRVPDGAARSSRRMRASQGS